MAETPQVRLAEVVGALSLATDVGMGSPLELGLGTCLVARRLADELGCDAGRAAARVLGRDAAPHRLHGRLARVRGSMDNFAIAAQLGLIPEPQATGATA